MEKFKTFAFTLNPRDGVSTAHLLLIEKYTRKHCEYYHVITEKTGSQRHIHAAWILKSPVTRSHVSMYMKRMFSDLDPIEQKVMLQGLKVMYNKDFIESYMDKNDDTVVICSNLPEKGSLETYFPPKKEKAKPDRRLAYHQMMDDLEKLWHSHVSPHVEKNTANARDFLYDMQYNKRLIGLMDDKKLNQVSRWLVRWMNKAETCLLDLPPFEKEEGPGMY